MTALRVLLIEDDAMIGALLAELLADLGYDVCPVEKTEAGAVAAAARSRPDLIIADVTLADGSGVSAVERVSRAGPVPHLFISGDVFQPAMPGAVLLRKPFRVADLVQAIGRALDAAGAETPASTLVSTVAPPAASP